MDRYRLKVVDVTKIHTGGEREEWTEAKMEPHNEGPYCWRKNGTAELTRGNGTNGCL